MYIDHIDIITSHKCNNKCKHCIDKFIHCNEEEISLETIKMFLDKVKPHVGDRKLTVLLLGGEPTMLSEEKLIEIAKLIRSYGWNPSMSTNGIQKNKIINILPYFNWIQITVNNSKQIEFWKNVPNSDHINFKIPGGENLNLQTIEWFAGQPGLARKSISMYFTPDFHEVCKDPYVWELLDTLNWKRNGSYEYAFYKGIRIKKCIHGETNIIDEPTVPKVYPNGNYNKTWDNEDMDDYL